MTNAERSRSALFAAAVCLAMGLILTGCGQNPNASVAPNAPEAGTPEEMLHSQLRSGSIQLKAVLETISEAQTEESALSKSAKKDEKEALSEIRELIDSTADAVAEFGVDPPAESVIKAEFAKFDEQRLQAIVELNDAYVDLSSAQTNAASLADADSGYQALAELLELAKGDLKDAILGFGGQIETDSDPGTEVPAQEDPPQSSGSGN